MIRNIEPGPRGGAVRIPSSKSQAHRLLIEAALAEGETRLSCDGLSRDILATMACLNALGADITESGGTLTVRPIEKVPAGLCRLPCAESGSTLRFLLPLVGALGARAEFIREGRLPQRPLAPLDGELRAHGMVLTEDGPALRCEGRLSPGSFTLAGNVSSQYVSGLLMALPLLDSGSRLTVLEPVESQGYIAMTEDALLLAGLRFEKQGWVYAIPGGQRGKLPPRLTVEGDWSNAAFFLAVGALSPAGVRVLGMNPDSAQGDRAILEILRRFGAEIRWEGETLFVRRGKLCAQTVDASPIPDLIPVLSVVAAAAEGESRFVNAARLRLKESDRLKSTAQLLTALGGDVEELPEGLIVRGRERLKGGRADSVGDHRIAMSAAVAACVCEAGVTVEGADCVAKSYPRFWEDFDALTEEET